MTSVASYLQRLIVLHKLLNSDHPPQDLDAQYEAHRTQHQALLEATDAALRGTFGPDKVIGLHDAWIENFSEKRSGSGWRTRFSSHPIVYQVGHTTGGEELGYCPIEVELSVRQPLREIGNCEVYACVIDPDSRQIGFVVHQRKPGKPSMEVVVAEYDNLAITHGPLKTWDQLYISRAQALPFVAAELTVQRKEGEEKFAATWHSDGSILVQNGAQVQAYTDFSSGLYGNHPLGSTQEVFIHSPEAGITAAISANSDDGYYGAYKKIRSYFRAQRQAPRRKLG